MLHAIISWCVRRRFAALLAALAVAAFGVHAYVNTPIEAYPDVTNFQVNVIAQRPGLAPQEIEQEVTTPLERVLNGVPGMISMRSESQFGLSLIFITFDDGADAFRSRMWVQERVQEADLPQGTDVTLGPDDTPLGEIYQYALTSDRHDLYQLRAAQDWICTRVFRQIPGVADVTSFGGYVEERAVEVDPARLQAHGLTLTDVDEALAKSNLNMGGGFMRRGQQETPDPCGGAYARSPRTLRTSCSGATTARP